MCRCAQPTRSLLSTLSSTHWTSTTLRSKSFLSSEARCLWVGGWFLFQMFWSKTFQWGHHRLIISSFCQVSCTFAYIDLLSSDTYQFMPQVQKCTSMKFHIAKHVPLEDQRCDCIARLQVELRGPRASLSSNYTSVWVTCRKVWAKNWLKPIENNPNYNQFVNSVTLIFGA